MSTALVGPGCCNGHLARSSSLMQVQAVVLQASTRVPLPPCAPVELPVPASAASSVLAACRPSASLFPAPTNFTCQLAHAQPNLLNTRPRPATSFFLPTNLLFSPAILPFCIHLRAFLSSCSYWIRLLHCIKLACSLAFHNACFRLPWPASFRRNLTSTVCSRGHCSILSASRWLPDYRLRQLPDWHPREFLFQRPETSHSRSGEDPTTTSLSSKTLN